MVLLVLAWGVFFTPQAVLASDGGVPIFINGPFELVTNYKATDYFVDINNCPNPEYVVVDKTSQITYSYNQTIIIPQSIQFNYNGYPSHCLTSCQNWYRFFIISSDGSITSIIPSLTSKLISIESTQINKLSTSSSAFGIFDTDNNSIYFNLTITKTTDGYFAIVPYFPQSQIINPTSAYGLNVNIQIYSNDTGEFVVAYSRKINQKFKPSIPNGNYKFIIDSNQKFLSLTLSGSGSCSSTSYIDLKINKRIEADFTIEDSQISNFVIISPTSLDNIIPEVPGSPYEHEELDITFPDYPSDDEEIEDTTFWGQLKRLVKFITDLFKSVGDFSSTIDPFVPLYNSWNKLKVKFPFCVINDMIELIPYAGYGCPVCFNCGTYNFGRGITGSFNMMKYICNIDQYLGSTFLTLIRSLLYAVIISPLVFVVYTSARNLFKNL